MGVVHCLYKREDWTKIKMRTWLDSVLLLALFSVGNQILCGVIQEEELPREARTISINSNTTSDIFEELGRLLQGTADILRTIVETKQDIVLPVIESAIAAKTSLINSPIVSTAIDAKSAVVRSLVESLPELTRAVGSVTGAVVETGAGAVRLGLCSFVCPITGEECRKDHCDQDAEGTTDFNGQPRTSKDYEDVYGDYEPKTR